MRLSEIVTLVDSTSDSAFAVDGSGQIVAWNRAAQEMFGLSAKEAVGRACGEILQGADECGPVCSQDCTVRQAVEKHRPVRNFDLQVQTKDGSKWCNLSVLAASDARSHSPYSIHIIRAVHTRKRLEMLVRDFVVNETNLPPEEVTTLISSTRAIARETDLTHRELEILRLLAKGTTTTRIASQLHISRTTVSNHIQHIHRKLNTHSQLEAVRRAEHAGLL